MSKIADDIVLLHHFLYGKGDAEASEVECEGDLCTMFQGFPSGFCGGIVDSVIMRLTDALMTFPTIVFALGIKALCLLLGALGIAGMWAAIFADVGVMVIAVLNATRALYTKDLTKN